LKTCVHAFGATSDFSCIVPGYYLTKGGKFAQLGEWELFARVEVGEDGDSIESPGELDFGADSLWYRAHPEAPVEELEVVKE